ncbi:GMC family oxidoreductase [Salmonella enterica]|uniref:GMC oxidoreductase n=1 Tax=Salmonella enterica TaxID=28901 RepID=UPI00073513AC|nr:GMC family oxidoreductase [Salmonella enterica]EEO7351681.1 GMC family oxidoreductase [Salmonella enterica]EFB0957568.1 GMC family oxidoreductase [Salmonella enterica]EFT0321801.1 GMC family oxidoreductase [Salmonella enterica]EFV0164464.1 GMC family oxidoreductase [Salmonella enterica]EGA2318495.1 GMC family oxidoreductase [Salmonella enterica]
MNLHYDYILIGSGVAATVLTQSLLDSDPNKAILILEAGPRIELRDRRSWWDIAILGKETSPPYEKTYDVESGTDAESSWTGTQWGFKESRVRALGGSTLHWGGWSLRYQPEDFELFSRTGKGADWPFSYDELEPWYTAAETLLSVGGIADEPGPPRTSPYPLPAFPWSAHEALLADAFDARKLVPGHMPIARFKRCMTTGTCKYCPIGSRYTATDHLASLLQNPAHIGLSLKTDSPVIRLVAGPSRVHGVRVLNINNGSEEVIMANCIVVCAGAYESPKLLLRSTSEHWPNGIGNRYDQVGRYLVTHTMVRVRGTLEKNDEHWFQEYDFPTLMSRTWDNPDRQSAGKVFVFNNRSLPNIDIASLMSEGKSRQQIDQIIGGPRNAGLDAFVEEFGVFNNRITLGAGVGKFGLPHTYVHFERNADFQAVTSKVLEEMMLILNSAGYQPASVKPTDVQIPRGDHSSGTCRMGKDETSSVTDLNLQVHGLENLYVCSNAVLPNASAVNPTLTLTALALRLGAYLSDKVPQLLAQETEIHAKST